MTFRAELSLWARRFTEEDENWTTTTTTAIQEESINLESETRKPKPIIVVRSSTSNPKDIVEKRYWRTLGESVLAPFSTVKHLLFFEATEDQLGLPGDAVASLSTWPTMWYHPEPESRLWRGIFSPPYHRRILFSQEVEIRMTDLPRWRPHITIDRRTLEREEND
jgi:hypothetical protein